MHNNSPIASVSTYIFTYKNEKYLGFHSFTEEKYEGLGLNTLLISIIFLRIYDEKIVKYIVSMSVSDISSYLLINKFDFKDSILLFPEIGYVDKAIISDISNKYDIGTYYLNNIISDENEIKKIYDNFMIDNDYLSNIQIHFIAIFFENISQYNVTNVSIDKNIDNVMIYKFTCTCRTDNETVKLREYLHENYNFQANDSYLFSGLHIIKYNNYVIIPKIIDCSVHFENNEIRGDDMYEYTCEYEIKIDLVCDMNYKNSREIFEYIKTNNISPKRYNFVLPIRNILTNGNCVISYNLMRINDENLNKKTIETINLELERLDKKKIIMKNKSLKYKIKFDMLL